MSAAPKLFISDLEAEFAAALTDAGLAPYDGEIIPGDGKLLPVANVATGEITSLQFIRPDGAKRFLVGGTVEIEAMPVPVLLDLVKDCIVQHIDLRHLGVTKAAEESERGILKGMLAEYKEGYWDGAGGEA